MAQRYLAALASALELSAALSAPAMKLDQVLQQGKLGTSVRYDQQLERLSAVTQVARCRLVRLE